MNSPSKSFRTLGIAVACVATGFIAGRRLSEYPAPASQLPPAPASISPTPDEEIANRAPHAESAISTPASLEDLRTALEHEDVLFGAAQAQAWLEAASLEDLRAFVSKRQTFELKQAFQSDFIEAFYGAFVERWLTLAPDDVKLLADSDPHFWTFRDHAARTKPELVLAEALRQHGRGPFTQFREIAFEALGGRDLTTARKLLAEITDPDPRLQSAILRGLAVKDPLAAAALLPAESKEGEGLPVSRNEETVTAIVQAAERAGPGVLRRLLAEHPDKFASYRDLPLLALRHPDLASDLAERGGKPSGPGWLSPQLIREAAELTPEERAQRLASYERLPSDALYVALAGAWARTEPQAALEWTFARAKPDEGAGAANHAVSFTFSQWLRNDSAAALAWWQKMPESRLRASLSANASTYLASQGDLETAVKMFRGEPVNKSIDSVTTHLAQLYARHDPAAAANWLVSLPSATAEHAVTNVVSRYYQSDPDGATTWLESLTPGPVREKALEQFLRTAVEFDPAGAAERVERIADPALRAKASQTVARWWLIDNPPAARAWAEKQPGLDAVWRARFLRK